MHGVQLATSKANHRKRVTRSEVPSNHSVGVTIFTMTYFRPKDIKRTQELTRNFETRTMHTHSTNMFPEETVAQDSPIESSSVSNSSIIKKLSLLDRFLALWIFLAMVLGILLGCFVPSTQEVLQAATLIGVSAPIGNNPRHLSLS